MWRHIPGDAECYGGYGRLHSRNDLMTRDRDTYAITLFFPMTVQPPHRTAPRALFGLLSISFPSHWLPFFSPPALRLRKTCQRATLCVLYARLTLLEDGLQPGGCSATPQACRCASGTRSLSVILIVILAIHTLYFFCNCACITMCFSFSNSRPAL